MQKRWDPPLSFKALTDDLASGIFPVSGKRSLYNYSHRAALIVIELHHNFRTY